MSLEVKAASARHSKTPDPSRLEAGDTVPPTVKQRIGGLLQTPAAGGPRVSLKDVAGKVKHRMSQLGGGGIMKAVSNTDLSASGHDLKTHKPAPHCEPTYRMEPEGDKKFSANKVEKLINATLERELEEHVYDALSAPMLSCKLANLIKREVTELNFGRYKYVCHVMLGENQGQGLEAASRCVFNETLDTYACGRFENNSLFASVAVYGLYFD